METLGAALLSGLEYKCGINIKLQFHCIVRVSWCLKGFGLGFVFWGLHVGLGFLSLGLRFEISELGFGVIGETYVVSPQV